MKYYIIEKNKPLHVHAHCSTLESAQYWLKVKAPEYVRRGYYMDKTLTADSFEVLIIDPLKVK